MARRSRTTRTLTSGVADLSAWSRAGVEPIAEGTRWADAFAASGLDFTVATAPVEFHTPNGEARTLTGKTVLYREDTGEGLAVNGRRYTPSQNRDTILRLGEGFEAQGATPAGIGVMDNGAAFWGLLAVGDGIAVPGDDSLIQGYLLIASSHDGTVPTTVRNLAFRFDCANTFDFALMSGVRHFRAKHTLRSPGRVDDYAGQVEALGDGLAAFGEFANLLASREFTDAEWRKVVEKFRPLPTDGEGKVLTDGIRLHRAQDAQDAILALRGKATISGGMEGTAWGALNALTEATDYLLGVEVAPDKRNLAPGAAFRRTVWGGTNPDKARALSIVAEVAGVSLR